MSARFELAAFWSLVRAFRLVLVTECGRASGMSPWRQLCCLRAAPYVAINSKKTQSRLAKLASCKDTSTTP